MTKVPMPGESTPPTDAPADKSKQVGGAPAGGDPKGSPDKTIDEKNLGGKA